MKKKVLLLSLLTTMLLSACGGTPTTSSTSNSNSQPSAESNTDNTADQTETSAESNTDNDADQTETSAESQGSGDSTIVVEEAVILDQDGVTITVTGFSQSLMGQELKMLIENDSDNNITVMLRHVSVNGYMINPAMSEDVTTGKKSNSSMLFMSSDLEKCEINTITDITFGIHIVDSSSWETIYDSEMITVKTSAADSYIQSYNDSGNVIYDSNGIKIVSKGIAEDIIFGPAALLYIENNTEHNISIQVNETSVNGLMLDPVCSIEVSSGKKIVSGITFFSSQLEENSITAFEIIETSFHIFDTDSWDNIIDTEPVVITF